MPIGNNDDFANNREPRCPVVLLLDNSGSMSGQPIQQLNQGVTVFKQSVDQDALASVRVEVEIVSFIQIFSTIKLMLEWNFGLTNI